MPANGTTGFPATTPDQLAATVDVLAGLNAAVAILAALTGGGGRKVEAGFRLEHP